MAEKVRVTIVVEYEVTPGINGWSDCPDLASCVEMDRQSFEDGTVGADELVYYGDSKVTFEAVDG